MVPGDRAAFLAAMVKRASERRRDGAYDWGIYEDAAREGAFVETFHIDSWLEHMRQHQRITNADRVPQDAVRCRTRCIASTRKARPRSDIR